MGCIKLVLLFENSTESESCMVVVPQSLSTPLARLPLTETATATGTFLTCDTRELYPLKSSMNLGQ